MIPLDRMSARFGNPECSIDVLRMYHLGPDHYQLIIAGRRGALTHKASEAISNIMVRMDVRSRWRSAMRNTENSLRHIANTIPQIGFDHFCDLADDNVWPIFCASLSGSPAIRSMPVRYSKTTARQYISEFMELNSLSKSDWKWLNSLHPSELYQFFDRPGMFDLRFNEDIICDNRDMMTEIFQESFRNDPVFPTLKRILDTDEAQGLHPETFRLVVSDMLDLRRYQLDFDWRKIYNAKSWQDFERQVNKCHRMIDSTFDRQRRLYGGERWGFIGWDMARIDLMDQYTQPEEVVPDGPFKWCDKYPHFIEDDDFKAHLLSTKELVVNEGKEMQHCLGRLYVSKIHRGEYIAFHINSDLFPKPGLTCGLRKYNGHWQHDQTRGVKNSSYNDPNLKIFIQKIVDRVNSK